MPGTATKMVAKGDSYIPSFDAKLDEATRWELFDKTAGMKWNVGAKYAQEEYGIRKISRSAWYRWRDRMDKMSYVRKAEETKAANIWVREFAATCDATDEQKANALANMAMRIAVKTNDAKPVCALIAAAADLKNVELKKRELALKAAAQKTKDEALKLAQDKFAAAQKELVAAKVENAGLKAKLADPVQVAAELDKLLGRKTANKEASSK